MTPKQFDEIVIQARQIAFGNDDKSGKHAVYNSNDANLYKATGLIGRLSDIWRKAIRCPAAIHTGKFDDKLRRDILDLIVYCVMFCVVYDEQKKENNDESIS